MGPLTTRNIYGQKKAHQNATKATNNHTKKIENVTCIAGLTSKGNFTRFTLITDSKKVRKFFDLFIWQSLMISRLN
jgi:hypothetical protein